MKVTSFSEEIMKTIQDLSFRRAEILEEFTKAYLVHLSKSFPVEEIMDHIELVEQWSEDRKQVRWFFRERKIPLKQYHEHGNGD